MPRASVSFKLLLIRSAIQTDDFLSKPCCFCCFSSFVLSFLLFQNRFAALPQMSWNIDLSECCRIWKGGCIIRAAFLSHLQTAYVSDPRLSNLLIDPSLAAEMNRRQLAWRRVVTLCVASGTGVPALSSSLSYFDSYRRASLPASLTQAQRDFFGGHTYERVDMPGSFHTQWTSAHKDIGNLQQRTAGNM